MQFRRLVTCALLATACESVKNRAVSTPPAVNAPLDPSFVAELSINTGLIAQNDVPLRADATPQSLIREMIVAGDEVHIIGSAQPDGSFLHVSHNGLGGWALGSVFAIAPPAYVPPAETPVTTPTDGDQPPPSSDPTNPTAPVDPPSSPPTTPPPTTPPPFDRDSALTLAQTGVGFSYWWGGGAWLTSGASVDNAGVCTGTCPSCTHSGSYGADCSGYVAKIWQVPASNSDTADNSHPYTTYTFYNSQIDWTDIDATEVQPADAYVYNNNGEGHIFLYVSTDPAGSVYAYEARGCATGIVYNLRTIDQPYKPIRRNGW